MKIYSAFVRIVNHFDDNYRIYHQNGLVPISYASTCFQEKQVNKIFNFIQSITADLKKIDFQIDNADIHRLLLIDFNSYSKYESFILNKTDYDYIPDPEGIFSISPFPHISICTNNIDEAVFKLADTLPLMASYNLNLPIWVEDGVRELMCDVYSKGLSNAIYDINFMNDFRSYWKNNGFNSFINGNSFLNQGMESDYSRLLAMIVIKNLLSDDFSKFKLLVEKHKNIELNYEESGSHIYDIYGLYIDDLLQSIVDIEVIGRNQ